MSARFNAIGIAVKDMSRSLAFYKLLGLPVPEELDDHVSCDLPNGVSIMWDTYDVIRSFDPDWQPPIGTGMGLAFECASPAEVDSLYAEVVKAGFHGHKEPWDAFWGQRYAQLRDPDGNGVDLYAALPTV